MTIDALSEILAELMHLRKQVTELQAGQTKQLFMAREQAFETAAKCCETFAAARKMGVDMREWKDGGEAGACARRIRKLAKS